MVDFKYFIRGEVFSKRLKNFKFLFFKCKICNKKEIKIINSPSRLKKATGRCQSCSQIKNKSKETHFNRFKHQALYNRSKKIKNEFNLSFDEFISFTKITNCFYCHGVIDWENINRCNLDRINNSLNYSKENCVVCCGICNRIKNNILSFEEMMMLSPVLIQINKNRMRVF